MALADLNAKLCDKHAQVSLQLNYDKTLMLLRSLKAGEVTVDDFEMAPDGGWNLVMSSSPVEAIIPTDSPGSTVEG